MRDREAFNYLVDDATDDDGASSGGQSGTFTTKNVSGDPLEACSTLVRIQPVQLGWLDLL